MTARVACIGECMLELSGADTDRMALSYGGDTLNTAVYLSRLGIATDYITALGDDPYSDWMVDQWQSEGVGIEHVIRAPSRLPGLYAIRTDDRGERQFHYWRDQAPVRDLLTLQDWPKVAENLCGYDLIYLSGITLSLYSTKQRDCLNEVLARARRQGCRISFDTNFRPRGWPSPEGARHSINRTLPHCDIALPTLDDDRQVFGDLDAEACATRLRDIGIGEVVVKMDAAGCLISVDGKICQVNTEVQDSPVDTTGAGDSFNAAYLAGRLQGTSSTIAARQAHRLAGTVIMHRGAIIPRTFMPVEISEDGEHER